MAAYLGEILLIVSQFEPQLNQAVSKLVELLDLGRLCLVRQRIVVVNNALEECLELGGGLGALVIFLFLLADMFLK